MCFLSYWLKIQWRNLTSCRYSRVWKVTGLFVEYTFSVLLGKLEVCYGKPVLILNFLEKFGLSYHHLLDFFFNLKQNYSSWPHSRYKQDRTKPCTLHIHRAIKIYHIYIGQKIRLLDWLLVLCGETRLLFLSGSTCAPEIPLRHKKKTF